TGPSGRGRGWPTSRRPASSSSASPRWSSTWSCWRRSSPPPRSPNWPPRRSPSPSRCPSTSSATSSGPSPERAPVGLAGLANVDRRSENVRKPPYDAARIEPERQAAWVERGDYRAPAPPPEGEHGVYVKSSSPFTSGNLHMGHVRDYTIGDAYARFQ